MDLIIFETELQKLDFEKVNKFFVDLTNLLSKTCLRTVYHVMV